MKPEELRKLIEAAKDDDPGTEEYFEAVQNLRIDLDAAAPRIAALYEAAEAEDMNAIRAAVRGMMEE